ncbi:spore protease YyaC [Sporolactobacillus sp. THM7-7]|nr:spore protease YyaC [Sporolactobacillus sp. THM7-7]
MKLKPDKPFNHQIYKPVHYKDNVSHPAIIQAIRRLLPSSESTGLIIVCIGTDRSTGDSLGPLVGSHLEKLPLPNTFIYGTLERPVHAVNLQETLNEIDRTHSDSFIIGIDACLGREKNVGKICVAKGPVLPGAGVNKDLIPVGDMNITGIVNVSGYMEYAVLQNTRLSIVMSLSEVISQCLYHAVLSREKSGLLTKVKFSKKA